MSKGAKFQKPGGGGILAGVRKFLTGKPKAAGAGAAEKLINMHKKKK